MAEIGVRELKTHASQIIRAVRDQRARYTVTYRGRPVGVLMPLSEASPYKAGPGDETEADVWQELVQLGEAIGQGWQAPETSTEILSKMRR
jgi:prevent-host-death family protein